MALQALSIINERGIDISRDSRLGRAISRIQMENEHYRAGQPFGHEEVERQALLMESFRTAWEAFVVVHAIVDRPRASAAITDELLRSFVYGPDLSEGDHSGARNFQFEALVGATLILGGLSVAKDEPDFRVKYHDELIGVAVKRLTSTKPGKLRDRLREARHQISNARMRGFVAVNLDSWIEDLGEDPDPENVGRKLNEQLLEAHRAIDELGRRSVILGAMVFANSQRWHFDEPLPRFEWRAPVQFIGFVDDASETEKQREFFEPHRERWENALAGLEPYVRPD